MCQINTIRINNNHVILSVAVFHSISWFINKPDTLQLWADPNKQRSTVSHPTFVQVYPICRQKVCKFFVSFFQVQQTLRFCHFLEYLTAPYLKTLLLDPPSCLLWSAQFRNKPNWVMRRTAEKSNRNTSWCTQTDWEMYTQPIQLLVKKLGNTIQQSP